jgi:DNA-binding transcriptional MerR regulator
MLTFFIVKLYHGSMTRLQQYAQQNSSWSLEDFVEVANDLLPQFLPEQATGSRGQEPVNPRLVRHYTTQGLLDKPKRQGREARYLYRHLLQLLVLRRLLADGYSTSSVGSLIDQQSNATLENLLQGGAQLTVETANPALAFLSQIRERGEASARQKRSNIPYGINGDSADEQQSVAKPPAPAPAQAPAPNRSSAPAVTSGAQEWTRVEILEGLELHVRQDFPVPTTAHERESLHRLIADHLTDLTQSRRAPP